MKFFHLADLHLGKIVHGYSMIEMGDQPYWMEQLLKKAEEHQPEAVLISGDIYDRAVPSKEAVRLFDELLTRLAERGIAVLLIAGNHDSGTRLSFGDQLLCRQGVYIAGEVKKEIRCVTLQDAYGPVHFWLVPYLFPAAVNHVLEREDLKDYDSAMKALLQEQELNLQERNVILAHQFVTAGSEKPTMGGSETTVGGIGQMDAGTLMQFDYAALGHIHRTQCMGSTHIRYAGSPLCYHFSEVGQTKGLTVIELLEKGTVKISVEELPVLHPMQEISGSMEQLLNAEVQKNSYVRAVIRQEILPPQAVELLRTAFAEKGAILMETVRERTEKKKTAETSAVRDVRMRSIEELFEEFYRLQCDGDLPDEPEEQLIQYVAEQTRNGNEKSEKERSREAEALIRYAVSGCGLEENG